MFRVTNSPILRCSFWLYIQLEMVEIERSSISTMAPVGSCVGALYQKLDTQSESAPEDGRICHPKHVGLN